MRVISARNVNDAWPQAIDLLEREGERRSSRNGDVVVHPMPVATVYSRPTERVLFDPVRDANPIFHLHEALWMLAGRDDATWLDRYVADFSSRFAEDGGRMHGAYGRRWRNWFEHSETDQPQGCGTPSVRRVAPIDQLDEVVRLLRANPYDRQAVIGMWDVTRDLGVPGLKDRPCNTQIYLRCDREQIPYTDPPVTDQNSAEWETKIVEGRLDRYLDVTVTCRSNDAVFGCYGANVVHFSFLQEYLAARIGVRVGRYTQISNNLHVYDWSIDRVDPASARQESLKLYPNVLPLVKDPDAFDDEVREYVENPTSPRVHTMRNTFFKGVAHPMHMSNLYRKEKQFSKARAAVSKIAAEDWRVATAAWIERRLK